MGTGDSCFFFFQAEDGIRDAQESRGLGDVYKRQAFGCVLEKPGTSSTSSNVRASINGKVSMGSSIPVHSCLLYTSDAADDLLCVDLGGRRIIKKKKTQQKDKNTIDTSRNIKKTQHNVDDRHTHPTL